LGRESEMSENF